MSAEEWRRVGWLPRFYEISNFGQVRSWSRAKNGGLIKQEISGWDGYPRVRLQKNDGKVKWYFVHELVARAFPESE